MSIPTVDDLKQHANITWDVDDLELTDMLDAALDVVGGIIGPVGPTEVTETHYGNSSGVLVLRQMPVASVTSISCGYFGGTPAVLDSANYTLDPATGIVRGVGFYGDVTVTYTAGSDNPPARQRLAILIIAAHLWETQRGTAPSALALQQQDGDPSFTPGASYAIPSRAMELLAPDIRPSIA